MGGGGGGVTGGLTVLEGGRGDRVWSDRVGGTVAQRYN